MSRVQDDPDLIEEMGGVMPKQIDRPIFVVHTVEGGKQQYLLHLTELDRMMNDPRVWGIVLSDLLDHIVAAYKPHLNRDERDIRAMIMRVMRDEDRFKEKDPNRGGQRGATLMPEGH